MYDFPDDFDPNVFIGTQLTLVAYAENLINLTFDEALRITALGDIAYRASNGGDEIIESPPVSFSSLVALVGRRVTGAIVRSPRTLALTFERNGSLTLTDGSDVFESFILRVGDREIVI